MQNKLTLFAVLTAVCLTQMVFSETEEKAVSLIPADGLAGWTTHYGKPLSKTRWKSEDGKLILNPPGKDYNHENGDIVSSEPYADFVLDFDWIATKGCNSGVKYRLADYGAVGAKINYSKTFGILGLEYQINDDPNNGEGKDPGGKNSAAGLYSIFGPDKTKKHLHPAGEINHGRIVVKGSHIEHWLNGEKVLEYTIGDERWKKAVGNSKFRDAKNFGENPSGCIMLQDHGHGITFTKLEIRKL